jgi:hypothetical protein
LAVVERRRETLQYRFWPKKLQKQEVSLTMSVTKSAAELKLILPGLDKMILAQAIEWGRRRYKAILEEVDEALAENKGKLAIEHRRAVWYQTCLGTVKIRRRQYQGGEGQRRCLLDECMGMSRYSHVTAKVRELALEMASTIPYRRSAQVLRKATAIDLAHQTIWRLVAQAADPYLDQARRETEKFMETGEIPEGEGRKVARLMVEADGVMLSLQRERERKTEVKLGIAYEGWEKVGKDRYRTVNKTCFATVGSGETFWSGMTLKLHTKYDLAAIKNTIVGGDGAKWVKEGADYVGGRFQLDRYHLNRELTTALGRDKETKGRVWHACETGEVDLGLRILAEAMSKAKGDQATRLARTYHYLRENRSGVADYRLGVPSECPGLRRTGAMEGNVDKLVVRRMKNQGMSWSVKGIRRLLCVRFLLLEGNLTDWLNKKKVSDVSLPIPKKRIRRIVNNLSFHESDDWLKAGLPVLSGPHADRPWASVLKNLTEVQSI